MKALEYIPQRPPMVMVDELVDSTESSATTRLNISPENIFTDNGLFTEPGMMENIAQTAAAMVGYQSKKNNVPVPIGFIAAVKNWRLYSLPKIHSQVETSIEVINSVGDISIVEGKVKQQDRVLCSCEIRILVQKSVQ